MLLGSLLFRYPLCSRTTDQLSDGCARLLAHLFQGKSGKSGKNVGVVICGPFESREDGFFERTIKAFPDVPIVLATACHDISVFADILRDGAHGYLLKPFTAEQLLLVVRRALEYRRLKLETES